MPKGIVCTLVHRYPGTPRVCTQVDRYPGTARINTRVSPRIYTRIDTTSTPRVYDYTRVDIRVPSVHTRANRYPGTARLNTRVTPRVYTRVDIRVLPEHILREIPEYPQSIYSGRHIPEYSQSTYLDTRVPPKYVYPIAAVNTPLQYCLTACRRIVSERAQKHTNEDMTLMTACKSPI